MRRTKGFFYSDHEKRLPLPSREAYEILCSGNTLQDINSMVHRFNLLVNKEKSYLRSLHRTIEKVDNQEFIADLDNILNRLNDAVTNEKPYKFLFGDVVQLKELLQVISGYYQMQLKAGLPEVKSYLRESSKSSSSFNALMSAISQHEKPLINTKESQKIEQFVVNNNAKSIMQKDIQMISEIVLMSFLADHKELNFSY